MTFSALLLAGGESRRMGRDKATMDFDGRPLWKRQLETLQTLDPEKIFVSARTPPSWLPDEVGLLLDDPPSRGPISGLTKALAAMGTTHLVVLAADMPFLVAGELRYLLKLTTGSRGVVPIIEERAEPLAAIYPAQAAEDFQAALEGQDSSLQPVVRKLAAVGKVTLCRVPEKRASLYRSVNEPEDLKL
ncbi:MAG: molybdenum cofactor guanylyltransferase [Verrucomicrobiota bacterium]|jgi:molybdopterin-guanine dinucleotide biosynthesis protein A